MLAASSPRFSGEMEGRCLIAHLVSVTTNPARGILALIAGCLYEPPMLQKFALHWALEQFSPGICRLNEIQLVSRQEMLQLSTTT